MPEHIYLDYNATTPLDPKIAELITPLYSEKFGNAASSSHQFGRDARKLVERSRNQIAEGIGCESSEIIFTSGATEALNMAIKGIVSSSNNEIDHIITLKSEHKAVLDSCEHVAKSGVNVDYIPVDKQGYVSISEIRSRIRQETVLVVIMHGNNEIGTLQPISEIGQLCSEYRVPLLVDAAQTLGKMPIDVRKSNISMMVGSAHKIYGPKGSGFLYKKSKVRIDPLIHGGGHEMGLRSGTHNVAGIVGLAIAFNLMQENQTEENDNYNNHTKYFLETLSDSGIEFLINGPMENRLPGNLNICLKGVNADWLTTTVPDIAIR